MENVFNNSSNYKKYFCDNFITNTYSENLVNDIANSNSKFKEEYLINLEGLINGNFFTL
jgi:hypothetical protein